MRPAIRQMRKKREYPKNIDEMKLLDDAIQTQIATIMAGDVKLDKAQNAVSKALRPFGKTCKTA